MKTELRLYEPRDTRLQINWLQATPRTVERYYVTWELFDMYSSTTVNTR